MQVLTLCWMFDKRWFFGLANPCTEYILFIPIIINTISLIGFDIERTFFKVDMDSPTIIVMLLWGLLGVTCMYLMVDTYCSAQQKVGGVWENYTMARTFMHEFEAKQRIWGSFGIVITLLVALQMILNRIYVSQHEQYVCLTNKIRFYFDLLCLGYILLVIFIFLVSKLLFLCMAWRKPESYLEYRSVL